MSAYPEKLNELEKTFMHVVNWMEICYDDTVWVLDIDFDSGQVMLVGDHDKVHEFRKELGLIMTDAFQEYALHKSWGAS
jgi:hypothetical protein